jgi:hypothetical protein
VATEQGGPDEPVYLVFADALEIHAALINPDRLLDISKEEPPIPTWRAWVTSGELKRHLSVWVDSVYE